MEAGCPSALFDLELCAEHDERWEYLEKEHSEVSPELLRGVLGRTSEELFQIARQFRDQLEILSRRTTYPTFRRFPRGSCGDASLLLGTFLKEIGEEGFEYALGLRARREWHGRPHSHAWLIRDRLVIDITADQFEEVNEPVIVSESSLWHRSWEVSLRQPADLSGYEHHGPDQLRPVYELLRKLMTSAIKSHLPRR